MSGYSKYHIYTNEELIRLHHGNCEPIIATLLERQGETRS